MQSQGVRCRRAGRDGSVLTGSRLRSARLSGCSRAGFVPGAPPLTASVAHPTVNRSAPLGALNLWKHDQTEELLCRRAAVDGSCGGVRRDDVGPVPSQPASADGTGAVADLERASLGLGTAPRLASNTSYPEFANLAMRSEDVLVSAGLADQSTGGWCANYICWYDAECGQNCVCLTWNGWWGFCWRHGP